MPRPGGTGSSGPATAGGGSRRIRCRRATVGTAESRAGDAPALEPTIDRRACCIKHRVMATNLVDALANIPMLSTLDRHHLERLAKDFSKRTFPAGSVV